MCGGAGVHLELLPTFPLGYNALHNRKNVSLPLTLRHLQLNVWPMANPVDEHMMIFEALVAI